MSNAIQATAFKAAIRQTQGGLCQGSNGDGLILQLDIPETEATPDLLAELMRLRRAVLVVTVMRADAVKEAARADDEGASEQGQAIEPETELSPSQATPDANGGAPTKRQRVKKAKPKEERTPEQRLNAEAWQILIHRSPDGHGRGFAVCPSVLEDIYDNSQPKEDKHEHDTLRRIFGKQLRNVGLAEAKARYEKSNTAQSMLEVAWRDAQMNLSRAAKRAGQPI